MNDFSCVCNALLIESCYTHEYKVIQEESLLIVRERKTGMKVLLLHKGNLLPPSLSLTTRNSKASAWTEPSHLIHLKEGTGYQRGKE
jgi:hypothetical protein